MDRKASLSIQQFPRNYTKAVKGLMKGQKNLLEEVLADDGLKKQCATAPEAVLRVFFSERFNSDITNFPAGLY